MMMPKQLPVILLISLLFVGLDSRVTALIAGNPLRGYHGAPIIDPYDSITINVNSDRVIECKGSRGVTWVSQLINDYPEKTRVTHFLHDSKSDDSLLFTDERNLYRSNLEISAAEVTLVGNYYCVFNDSLHEDANDFNYEEELIDYKASNIYVFVNDPENLLYQDHIGPVHGRQYEPFVIPCKPTSPQVRVELIKEDGEVMSCKTYSNRTGFELVVDIDVEDYFYCTASLGSVNESKIISFVIDRKYDPKIGYTVSFSDIEDSGYFECRLVDDHDTFVQFHVIVDYQPLSSYIEPPRMASDSDFTVMEGDPLHIMCDAEVQAEVLYDIYFILPSGKVLNASNDFATLSQTTHEHDNRRKSHRNLTITHAERSRDEGDYKCKVEDLYKNSNSAEKTVKFVTGPFVELESRNTKIENRKPNIKRSQFLVRYSSYPSNATFALYNNKRELVTEGDERLMIFKDKYEFKVDRMNRDVRFSVLKPNISDFGNYTLEAYVDGANNSMEFQLIVYEPPSCTLEDVYVTEGQEVSMMCECIAHPPAAMSWSFQACSNLSTWPECGFPRNDDDEISNKSESKQLSDTIQSMSITFTSSQPGRVTCIGDNGQRKERVTALAKIGDLPEPFAILGPSDDHQIANGDTVKFECGAIIYNYTDSVQWTRNGDELESVKGIEIVESNTRLSWRRSLIFTEISEEHAGEYSCVVHAKETDVPHTLVTSVRVHEAVAPALTTNFNQSTITRMAAETLTLECYVSGLPKPTLTWKKDDEDLVIPEGEQRVALMNGGMTLAFTALPQEYAGVYECIAENRIGTVRRSVEIVLDTPLQPPNMALIISVISIILVLVLLSLYLCLKVRIKKRQIAMLKAAGLANFEEGQVESIDPEMNLDEQADLLPYDKKFEFPREKLKLGKQLGAGAFGVVVKATAQGIVHYEDESTVAVKMVKKQTDNEVMKALVSELKIMIHMGQHLNVVNLLGAVTKNIAKRELMVIVEYCRFGNLQSFLVKHRPYFIDQVRNDHIDPMIMKNEMRWSKNSAYNSYNSQGLKYISVAFANDKIVPKEHSYINSINGNRYINFSEGNQYTPPQNLGLSNAGAHMNTQGYVRHSGFHQVDSCNTEATVVSTMETVMSHSGEENALLSNNSDQPLWRSNYATDYRGPARSVCTSDLVCWAFQVARGMDYLAQRKVLHGDLAARNILLCDDNIVKICDFGLARSMYKSDNYKKKGEAPLPFKWLSIEAISDHVFSTYSDVWAFGVVLWELFTLGKVPYTGMEANQELFYKLRDGYRMEKPKYATEDIYDVMLNCWNAKPESRPLFNQLERKLSSFMMNSVKDHYLDLNEPYLQANSKHYESGAPDYLTSLSVPDGEAPMPPLAQQEMFRVDNSTTDVPSTPDYLSMSPKSGVVKYNLQKAAADYLRPDSPTIAKNLDTSPKNKKNVNKRPQLPEEMPMLVQNHNGHRNGHESDEEPLNSTYTDMRVRRNSSGRKKRQAPQPPAAAASAAETSTATETAESTSDPEYKNIFATSENYVNVPAISKSNASVANPAYITFQSVNERA